MNIMDISEVNLRYTLLRFILTFDIKEGQFHTDVATILTSKSFYASLDVKGLYPAAKLHLAPCNDSM